MTQATADTLPPLAPPAPARPIKLVPWPLLVGVVVAHTALSIYANFALFRGDSPLVDIQRASQGLISGTLIANLLNLALIVGVLIVGVGGLRPRDIGLEWRKLPAGLAITLGAWAAMQLVELVALLDPHITRVASMWQLVGPRQVIGDLVGQLAGNALFEEVVYRGFLLPQLYLLLLRRWPQRARRSAFVALLLSQAIFALMHIPNRLANGDTLLTILSPFVAGLALAALYLRTGNLFIAVGLHALDNYPAMVLETNAESWVAREAIVFLLIMPWEWLTRFGGTPAESAETRE